MIGPKKPLWRSKPYRMFVASHACFACGMEGRSQAAHPNDGKGLGLKTDDSRCFPLCSTLPLRVGCHDQHDQCIDMTREQRRELEAQYVKRMQSIAREAGWFRDREAA